MLHRVLYGIHRAIDGSGRPTWWFEKWTAIALETILLIVCALPAVHDCRSAGIAVMTAALRLYQAETAREKGSIVGRRAEKHGGPLYPPHKQRRLDVLAWRDNLITWLWPVLLVVVAADTFGWPAGLALGATIVRASWARLVMPAWRRSRTAWRGR